MATRFQNHFDFVFQNWSKLSLKVLTKTVDYNLYYLYLYLYLYYQYDLADIDNKNTKLKPVDSGEWGSRFLDIHNFV
jgi:hypothetical protein